MRIIRAEFPKSRIPRRRVSGAIIGTAWYVPALHHHLNEAIGEQYFPLCPR